MKDLKLSIGSTYAQDSTSLRVLAVQERYVLLEQSHDSHLIQYIVTNGLFLEDEELHWRGSGVYFPCMYAPPICDSPFDALRKAMEYMTVPLNKRETGSISFTIPNGIQIKAKLNGEAAGTGKGWSGIDIFALSPSGQCEYLCCADYETKDGNPDGYDRLRVMTYKASNDEPDSISSPLPHCSIWITHDEGSYDVNVWDEDLDERDDCLEISRIPTFEEAMSKMEDIMKKYPLIIWTMRPYQEKGGSADD